MFATTIDLDLIIIIHTIFGSTTSHSAYVILIVSGMSTTQFRQKESSQKFNILRDKKFLFPLEF